MKNIKTLHNNRNTGKSHQLDLPIFRERLEQLRKSKGITQKELAKEIGFSYESYQGWVNPKYDADTDSYKYNVPGLGYLMALSDYFNVSIDYLVGKTDYTTVNNEMISQETGLTDASIENIKALNEHMHGMNLTYELFNSLSNGTLKREPRLIMDTFNKLVSSEHFEDLIFSFDDFLRTHYNKPVHFEPGTGWQLNNRKVNNGVPCITLAYDETNLTENMDIPINDTFLETIALKEIEKLLYSMKRE